MEYTEFIKKISKINAPVVLIEGKRKVREEDRVRLIQRRGLFTLQYAGRN